MANVRVLEVESPAQLKTFILFPQKLYRDDPNFVAPLLVERKEFFNKNKNPFYRSARVKLFLCERSGEIVGRIATCVNFRHNSFHEEQTGFFGFFDTIDDQEVATQLLKVAMITLKKENMDRMRGPMNFSTNHECGFLVEGFDRPPLIMMTYNQPYQVELAKNFGLTKVMDLLAFWIRKETGMPPRFKKIVKKLRERSGVTVRSISMSHYDEEILRIKEVYNKAWTHNWGFVPMDDDEFAHMAKDMRQIIDPDLVLLAEFEGKPIGFCLALPDINQVLIKLKGKLFPLGLLKLLWHTKVRHTINSARIVTFGVVPEFQRRGVDSLLFVEVYERGVANGFESAELSWILESNELMCRGAEQMGAELYKRYRIMEMSLGG